MKKIKPGEPFQMGNQIWEYSLKEGAVSIKAVKELKPKKEDKIFIPPTLDEVKAFWKENGYNDHGAEQSFRYYSEAEPPWTDSRGKEVRSWKQKMRGIWFRDEFKLPQETKKANDPTNGVVM